MCKIYTSYVCHALSQYVTRCITVSHNVHKFTLNVIYVQKGVQLVTKVCYYLEFSYIYNHLIINKKALCLIAEGCTPGIHITNWVSIIYAVLFSDTGTDNSLSINGLWALREKFETFSNSLIIKWLSVFFSKFSQLKSVTF